MACPDVAGTPAQGTYVQIGNCASPEVFTTISGAMDISGPEKQRAEIEVTNHGTPTAPQTGKSYRPTLLDFGTISFQVIWDASDASHALLDTLIDSGEIRNFRLIDTDPSSDGKQFQAYVQKLGWEKCDEVVLPELIQIGIEGAVKKFGLPQTDALNIDEVADLMDGEQTNEYFATVIRAGNGQNVLDAFIALKNVNSRSETAAETTTQTTSSDPS